MRDNLTPADACAARLLMAGILDEGACAEGVFRMEHIREGRVIRREYFLNTVVTAGKNALLDAALAGAAYTVTGPFMGLISSVSFSAIAAGDTMASHAGWLEAGGANAPTYAAPRKTCAWSAATDDRYGYPVEVALAETIAVTSDTFTAKPPTGAIVPGAIDECALTVVVPGFDDDVTGYRVTMPGGPRVALAGDVRISMAGAVRFTIPGEAGAFRVTTAGNKRITLQ